jgi:hypothetical protein
MDLINPQCDFNEHLSHVSNNHIIISKNRLYVLNEKMPDAESENSYICPWNTTENDKPDISQKLFRLRPILLSSSGTFVEAPRETHILHVPKFV